MLRRVASLRGRRGCNYRAVRRAAIDQAVDRVRAMVETRSQRAGDNQGNWWLTASRPKPPTEKYGLIDRFVGLISHPEMAKNAGQFTPLGFHW